MGSTQSAGLQWQSGVLGRLEKVVDREQLDLGDRLADLRRLVAGDLGAVEAALLGLRSQPTPLHKSAAHLVSAAGKRVRPLCVLLAARCGDDERSGPRSGRISAGQIQDLAVAAELVHSATLLHDDVVDVGELRRGQPAARMIYGNAASIFAGDWLLVDALMRVRRSGLTDVLDRALLTLDEMLEAEAIQLEGRGRLDSDEARYFRVIEGKTASLFAWALYSGARAGGLDMEACEALARFGRKIGIAFQLVDDAMDFSASPGAIGKGVFADLAEGKMTLPLLLALQSRPALLETLQAHLAGPTQELTKDLLMQVRDAIEASDAAHLTRARSKRLTDEALADLYTLPQTPARAELEAVALAMVERKV